MVCLTRKSMLLMPLLMKKSLHATCSVDSMSDFVIMSEGRNRAEIQIRFKIALKTVQIQFEWARRHNLYLSTLIRRIWPQSP